MHNPMDAMTDIQPDADVNDDDGHLIRVCDEDSSHNNMKKPEDNGKDTSRRTIDHQGDNCKGDGTEAEEGYAETPAVSNVSDEGVETDTEVKNVGHPSCPETEDPRDQLQERASQDDSKVSSNQNADSSTIELENEEMTEEGGETTKPVAAADNMSALGDNTASQSEAKEEEVEVVRVVPEVEVVRVVPEVQFISVKKTVNQKPQVPQGKQLIFPPAGALPLSSSAPRTEAPKDHANLTANATPRVPQGRQLVIPRGPTVPAGNSAGRSEAPKDHANLTAIATPQGPLGRKPSHSQIKLPGAPSPLPSNSAPQSKAPKDQTNLTAKVTPPPPTRKRKAKSESTIIKSTGKPSPETVSIHDDDEKEPSSAPGQRPPKQTKTTPSDAPSPLSRRKFRVSPMIRSLDDGGHNDSALIANPEETKQEPGSCPRRKKLQPARSPGKKSNALPSAQKLCEELIDDDGERKLPALAPDGTTDKSSSHDSAPPTIDGEQTLSVTANNCRTDSTEASASAGISNALSVEARSQVACSSHLAKRESNSSQESASSPTVGLKALWSELEPSMTTYYKALPAESSGAGLHVSSKDLVQDVSRPKLKANLDIEQSDPREASLVSASMQGVSSSTNPSSGQSDVVHGSSLSRAFLTVLEMEADLEPSAQACERNDSLAVETGADEGRGSPSPKSADANESQDMQGMGALNVDLPVKRKQGQSPPEKPRAVAAVASNSLERSTKYMAVSVSEDRLTSQGAYSALSRAEIVDGRVISHMSVPIKECGEELEVSNFPSLEVSKSLESQPLCLTSPTAEPEPHTTRASVPPLAPRRQNGRTQRTRKAKYLDYHIPIKLKDINHDDLALVSLDAVEPLTLSEEPFPVFGRPDKEVETKVAFESEPGKSVGNISVTFGQLARLAKQGSLVSGDITSCYLRVLANAVSANNGFNFGFKSTSDFGWTMFKDMAKMEGGGHDFRTVWSEMCERRKSQYKFLTDETKAISVLQVFEGNVNAGHFACVVIDRRCHEQGIFTYFDSGKSFEYTCMEDMRSKLNEMGLSNGEASIWIDADVPQQAVDTFDCGVWMCLFVTLFLRSLNSLQLEDNNHGRSGGGLYNKVTVRITSEFHQPQQELDGKTHWFHVGNGDDLSAHLMGWFGRAFIGESLMKGEVRLDAMVLELLECCIVNE